MKKTLLAIDGNSLMHRAFWALPPMNDRSGRATNAIYGFLNMLFNLITNYQPTHVVVAFDKKGKTFRHSSFAEYKAGRRQTPPELTEQFVNIKSILSDMDIFWIEKESFEADDILGTYSKMPDMKKYIVTGDRDALQLISDDTTVLLTRKGVTETEEYTKEYLFEKMQITPGQIVDLKSLMGDSSDNIPGVAGVGEKTALKLLYQYSTLEELYAHIDELPKNKLKEKLENDKDNAVLSKYLATICTDVDLGVSVDECVFSGFDSLKLAEVFSDYDFGSFMKKFGLEKKVCECETKNVSLAQAKEILDKADEIAFHLGDNLHFAVDSCVDYVINIKYDLLGDGCDYSEALGFVKNYTDKKLVLFDAKKYMHLLSCSIENFFDCLLAAWVVNPVSFPAEFETMCAEHSLAFCAASLFALKEYYSNEIHKAETEYIYYDIELPLAKVLYDMEKEGVYANEQQLVFLNKKYGEKIQKLASDIYDLAGKEFNILSPKQLGTVLFEDLGLPVIKKNKTGYSTDQAVLEKLEGMHPIIDSIKEYRQLTKLKSTYVDGLLAVLKNGKVHTTFLQVSTATGRLSSVEPNLQNIPIKSELAADIRSVFYAPEDYVILSADYSQIELRILAHIADDENLKDAFILGQDIHARTASEILGKDISDVTPKERSDAKAVNFGIVYGISDFGLARNTGISVKKAAGYIKKYLEEFSGVKGYMDNIKAEAHETGYVRTMWGRVRYIPELSNSNFNIRSFGERAALNTPIQGSAADIIKLAMLKVHDALAGYKSKLVLQVHDELIIYAHKDEVDDVINIVRDNMRGAVKLNVPLEVNIASGKLWSEAK